MKLTEKIVVVGGGLAGLVCASRLHARGKLLCLIDIPVNNEKIDLGGFAEFSGAKFSLLPAGTGLIPVAGSVSIHDEIVKKVVQYLHLQNFELVENKEMALSELAQNSLELRAYSSFLLTPTEIATLIADLAKTIPSERIRRSKVVAIERENEKYGWCVLCENGEKLAASKIVVATGRTNAEILKNAGALPQVGKGIDLGVRIEFSSRNGLKALRALGADAKILMDDCRTFCLNSPGQIFHYNSGLGVQIPGGVVADSNVNDCNVGLLCRIQEKQNALQRIRSENVNQKMDRKLSYYAQTVREVIDLKLLIPILGEHAASRLATFVDRISAANLIDFDLGCRVHYPLIDWHWETYAMPSSFQTSEENLYAIGDLAGHARGLLQSAVAGWILGERLQ